MLQVYKETFLFDQNLPGLAINLTAFRLNGVAMIPILLRRIPRN